ncbi:MAG: hypothetical protein HUK04_03830 [Bacteroidaceae bacterium]|nr:hypothetical protein [Bacteroidaceae bacterium]
MKRLTQILLLLFVSLTAHGQKDGVHSFLEKGQVNFEDSAKLYATLLANTPIEPEFTYAPHFAIVGFGGNFYFSTGARLRFTGSYDWGNPVRNPSAMGVEGIEKVDTKRGLFQMGAGTSKLYFNIIGFPNTGNQVGLFVSLNLDASQNNTYSIKAGQVYMRYRHIQCGYATSLYNDRAADSYAINDASPCASGSHSAVQINYQHALTKHITCGIGVEMPRAEFTRCDTKDIEEDYKQDNTYQRIPDIPLYLDYSWGSDNHVRLSGIIRNISYYDITRREARNVFGWGLKLTGKYCLGPLTLYGMVQGGKAIANYVAGNSESDLDLVPAADPARFGELEATKSFGVIGAIQYDITHRVFVTALYSMMRNYTPDYHLTEASIPWNSQLRRGMYASANIVWRISDLFSTGLEYCYGSKRLEGGAYLHNNRLFGMFMMNF